MAPISQARNLRQVRRARPRQTAPEKDAARGPNSLSRYWWRPSRRMPHGVVAVQIQRRERCWAESVRSHSLGRCTSSMAARSPRPLKGPTWCTNERMAAATCRRRNDMISARSSLAVTSSEMAATGCLRLTHAELESIWLRTITTKTTTPTTDYYYYCYYYSYCYGGRVR